MKYIDNVLEDFVLLWIHNLSKFKVYYIKKIWVPQIVHDKEVTFDTILPPTKDEIINHLKKPIIFGCLDQKREFIVNRVIPLRADHLQMMRALRPSL